MGGVASALIVVLIDTWWNVNPARGIKLLNGINRFNRYMVECECYHKRYGYIGIGVLIDTWWNVNLSRKQSLTVNPLVLIDTWWNVNFTHY